MFKNLKNDFDKENKDNININLTLNIQRTSQTPPKKHVIFQNQNIKPKKPVILGKKINNTQISLINNDNNDNKQYPVLIEQKIQRPKTLQNVKKNQYKPKTELPSNDLKNLIKPEKNQDFHEIIEKIKSINPFLKKIFELKEGDILVKEKTKVSIKKSKKLKKKQISISTKPEVKKPEIISFTQEKINRIDKLISENLKKIRKEQIISEAKEHEERSQKLKKMAVLREKNENIREINKTRFLNNLTKGNNVIRLIPKKMTFSQPKTNEIINTCRTLHKKRVLSPEELTTLREFMNKKRLNYKNYSKKLKKQPKCKKIITKNQPEEKIDIKKVWKTAAIFIQKFWKGYKARKNYQEIKQNDIISSYHKKYSKNNNLSNFMCSDDLVKYEDFSKENSEFKKTVDFKETIEFQANNDIKENLEDNIRKNDDKIEIFHSKKTFDFNENFKENLEISNLQKNYENEKNNDSHKNSNFSQNSDFEKHVKNLAVNHKKNKDFTEEKNISHSNETPLNPSSKQDSLIELSSSSFQDSQKNLEFHTIYSEKPIKLKNLEICMDNIGKSPEIRNCEGKLPANKSCVFEPLIKYKQIHKHNKKTFDFSIKQKWENLQPRALFGPFQLSQIKEALKAREEAEKIRKNQTNFNKNEVWQGFREILRTIHQAKIDQFLLKKLQNRSNDSIKNCLSEGDAFRSIGSVSDSIPSEKSVNSLKKLEETKKKLEETDFFQKNQNNEEFHYKEVDSFIECYNEKNEENEETIEKYENIALIIKNTFLTPQCDEKEIFIEIDEKSTFSSKATKIPNFQPNEVLQIKEPENIQNILFLAENERTEEIILEEEKPKIIVKIEEIQPIYEETQQICLSKEPDEIHSTINIIMKPNYDIKKPLISSPLAPTHTIPLDIKQPVESLLETNDTITENITMMLLEEILSNPLIIKGFSHKIPAISPSKLCHNPEIPFKSPPKEYLLEIANEKAVIKKELAPEVQGSLAKLRFKDIFLEYLIQFKSIILYEDESIKEIMLDNINEPLGFSEFEKLKKSKENASKFTALLADNVILPFLDRNIPTKPILPPELFPKIHQQIALNYGSFDEKYFKSILDAFNELLNYYRPLGTKGKAYIWDKYDRNHRISSENAINEAKLEEIIEECLNKIESYPDYLCGIYIDRESFLKRSTGNFEDFLARTREEKMKKMLMKEFESKYEDWTEYLDDDLEIKLEISSLIYEDLIKEMVIEMSKMKK